MSWVGLNAVPYVIDAGVAQMIVGVVFVELVTVTETVFDVLAKNVVVP